MLVQGAFLRSVVDREDSGAPVGPADSAEGARAVGPALHGDPELHATSVRNQHCSFISGPWERWPGRGMAARSSRTVGGTAGCSVDVSGHDRLTQTGLSTARALQQRLSIG